MDKDRATAGSQAIVANDAVLFTIGSSSSTTNPLTSYLLVASGTAATPASDLLVRMPTSFTASLPTGLITGTNDFITTA